MSSCVEERRGLSFFKQRFFVFISANLSVICFLWLPPTSVPDVAQNQILLEQKLRYRLLFYLTGAPLVRFFGKSIDAGNFDYDVSVRPSARPPVRPPVQTVWVEVGRQDSLWGRECSASFRCNNNNHYYSTITPFNHIWSKERAKYDTVIHCSVPV